MGTTLIGALAFAYAGMVALCLGLERHYKALWGRAAAPRTYRALRATGWGALAASFYLCCASWGWAMGPVGWCGAISLAGITLVLMLPYVPRLAVGLAGAAPGWLMLASF